MFSRRQSAGDILAQLTRCLPCILLLLFTCAATEQASAQNFPPGIMVCQTPTFWCAVPAPDYPSGTPCWCNTTMGPIGGFAINPRQVIQQTPSPRPPKGGDKRPSEEGEPEEEIDLGEKADDCLNGLGNCSGDFKSLVRQKAKKSSMGQSGSDQQRDRQPSGSVPSSFSAGIRKLAEAAEEGEKSFEDLRIASGRSRDGVDVSIPSAARCSMSKGDAKRILCRFVDGVSRTQAINSFEQLKNWLTATLGEQGWIGTQDDLGEDEIKSWRFEKSRTSAEISVSADKDPDESTYSTYIVFRAAR